MTTVSPSRLEEIRKSGRPVALIDVRTPVEFRELHADVAHNIPLDQLDPQALQGVQNGTSDAEVYVICRTGNRSSKACEKLIAAGLTNVISIEGGVEAWEAAGLPVVRGKKAMSLERQVRIAAGSLVLLGVGLSFANPYFLGLSAFVGAGLVFAGITDTCGMGMVLARMPWNKVRETTPVHVSSTDENCENVETKTTQSCCA